MLKQLKRNLMLLPPALAVAMVVAGASPSPGATLNVPSEAYPTIQSAIDAAADGDTVQVAPGVYPENLVLAYKSIELIGAGADVTIVDGGGVDRCLAMVWVPDTARVEGFTFTGGVANPPTHQRGGCLFLYISSPTVANNIITNGEAHLGAGVGIDIGCAPTFIGNVITDNHTYTGYGGGVNVFTSAPTFIDNVITENTALRGGGVTLFDSAAVLEGNTIMGNTAGLGGGVQIDYTQSPHFRAPTLTNNVIAQNVAGLQGGGVYLYRSSALFTNNTIADNVGGGFYHSTFHVQSPVIVNCILFGNAGYDIYGAECTVAYSDIGVGPPWVGPTNISTDPMFVDPTSGDYHLGDGSPCIDAGSNDAPGLPLTDKDGNDRVVDGDGDGIGEVDMGAYEWQGPSLVEVAIDIKPGTYPNAINNDGHGVIPVAVLGSATFDVNWILVPTVKLEGLSIKIVGKADKLLYHYEDVNADGFEDLVVMIQDADGALADGAVTATVTGLLIDEATPFVGCDEIVIVPPK